MFFRKIRGDYRLLKATYKQDKSISRIAYTEFLLQTALALTALLCVILLLKFVFGEQEQYIEHFVFSFLVMAYLVTRNTLRNSNLKYRLKMREKA